MNFIPWSVFSHYLVEFSLQLLPHLLLLTYCVAIGNQCCVLSWIIQTHLNISSTKSVWNFLGLRTHLLRGTQHRFYFIQVVPLHVRNVFRHFFGPSSGMSIKNLIKDQNKIIIIIFLNGLSRLTCSGIDALPLFPRVSTVSSSSRFVVEGVFRESGVAHSFKVVDPVLFVFEPRLVFQRSLVLSLWLRFLFYPGLCIP